MDKKYFLLIQLFVFNFGISCSFAQTEISLEKVYDLLDKQNIQLSQSYILEKLSDQDVKDAKNNLFPRANLNVSNNYNYGLSFDQVAGELVSGNRWSNSANLGLSASFKLFDGLNSFNTIKKAVLEKESKRVETKYLRRTLQLEAAAVFFDILANEELYKVSEEHLALSNALLEQEVIQFETGVKTKVDLALAQTRVSADETNSLISKNTHLSRLIDLKQLINIPLSDSINLLVPQKEELLLKDSSTYDLDSTPNVILAKFNREDLELQLKIAKSAYLPELDLNTSYGTNYSSERNNISGDQMLFFDQLSQNKFLYIGFSLNVPLFDAFQTKGSIKKTKLNIKIQEKELNKIRLEEEKIWNLAWQEYRKSIKEHQSLQLTFESAAASYEAMKERYDAGVSSYFELSTTLMERNVAEFNLIKSKYTMLYAAEVIQLLYDSTN